MNMNKRINEKKNLKMHVKVLEDLREMSSESLVYIGKLFNDQCCFTQIFLGEREMT